MTREQKGIIMGIRRFAFVTPFIAGVLGGLSVALAAVPKYSVETVPEYDAVFERTMGWTGGDGVYSVGLGKDVTLWLFSDTWIGPVVAGGHKDATLVHNTVAIQRGAVPSKDNVKFYWGKAEDSKPEALIKPDDGVGWFWIFDGVVAHGKLYLFLMQTVKTDSKEVFGFKQVGTWLGEVENPLDEPGEWRVKQYKIPHGRHAKGGNTFFGSALMKEEKLVYIYGAMEDWSKGFSGRSMIVASVPAEEALSDFGAWRFYGEAGWKVELSELTALFEGAATEYSVSYQPGIKKYVAIYTENGMSKKILMRTAPRPTGPWTKPEKVFECPEVDWHATYFCYAAKGHPEISSDDELIVTYVCNSMDFWQMAQDARIYRPRFLRIRFEMPHP